MLKFFEDVIRYLPGPYWKTRRSFVKTLLEGQKVELILAITQPFYPSSTKYYGKERREKRDLSTANFANSK